MDHRLPPPHRPTEEELAVMDPLKALKQNAEKIIAAKSAKVHLVKMAIDQGYSFTEIGKAIGQSDTAVRMFRNRHLKDNS